MNISIHSISNRLGIDRKIIRDWIKNEIILKNIIGLDLKNILFQIIIMKKKKQKI